MRTLLKTILLTAAFAGLAVPVAAAGDAGGPISQTVAVRDGGDSPSKQRITLGLNKAAIIELPADASDVLVSNPSIVDAIVRTPRRIYVLGLAVGQTNAFFFSASGKQLLNLEISVGRDTQALGDILSKHFPGTNIRAEAVNDNIVLTGVVPSATIADQARELAARYVGAPEKVLNMITIAGREQVMIRVRVAEMQRTVAKQLGIDLGAAAVAGGVPLTFASQNDFSLAGRFLGQGAAGGGLLPTETYNPLNLACDGSIPTTAIRSIAGTGVCPALNNTGGYNNVDGTVRALERAGILRLLSEPNLTAISGETANFMAGGQFPVPSGVDDNGNVRVEFKQFGVGLAFTPVVLSEGRINLKVSSEVSDLTMDNAMTLPSSTTRTTNGDTITTPGITIPGLRVRRAETTVEMPSGGSMMLAGLLQDDFKQNIDGYPGLKDLPVLGALFRSRDFQMNQSELVVILSAVLVDPVSGKELHAPTDGFVAPTDADADLNGSMNSTYKQTKAQQGAATKARASAGYIVE